MDPIKHEQATRQSFERLIAAEPQLEACVPLASIASLSGKTLLHAGPRLRAGVIPAPILNSAAAAACFEGWAGTHEEAQAAIAAGDIALAPAQDHGVVTPLAFVVSPSMWVLRVGDARGAAAARYTPINDGPPPGALRFGARHAEQSARLALLSQVGPALARDIVAPVALLPVLRAGLNGGDDLHGRVTAANQALYDALAPRLTGEGRAYLDLANQFVLNLIMASCAVMIGAGGGIADSRMVVAAGGNGVDFGWKLAGAPDVWHTMPAAAPVGPRFPVAGDSVFLPAIGDSAVIDACGFGAAALRYAPELMEALRGHGADLYFTAAASTPFLGAHPAFPADLHVGLGIDRAMPARGVMLAALDAAGEKGLIGRGVSPWPILA